MKLISKNCFLCAQPFQSIYKNKKYCGHQKEKSGCAYKVMLGKINDWNRNHPHLLKIWNKKAVEKYQNNKKLHEIL